MSEMARIILGDDGCVDTIMLNLGSVLMDRNDIKPSKLKLPDSPQCTHKAKEPTLR